MRASIRAAVVVVAVGCARPPEIYQPTPEYYVDNQIEFPEAGPQIERGRPNLLIDGLNHYLFSLPTKVLLWNWQLLDHELPDPSLRALEYYLEMNRLSSVKIRHNQYAPIGEMKRLFQNGEVGIGYRLTLGLLNWIRYTLLPDRLFAGLPIIGGGDHFNPFTNTVNVYSSDVTVLLHEAGHAKDYVKHEFKGTSFAMLRLLPGVDLLQEARASTDAIRFLHCIRDYASEERAYRTLIPAYSTYIAGYFQGGLQVTLPIVVVGHVSGRLHARQQRLARIRAAEGLDARWGGLGRDAFLPDWCVPIPRPADRAEESLPSLTP